MEITERIRRRFRNGLNKEIKSFEEISGSKINENKLEILRLRTQIKSFNMIPDKFVNDKIKTLWGIWWQK